MQKQMPVWTLKKTTWYICVHKRWFVRMFEYLMQRLFRRTSVFSTLRSAFVAHMLCKKCLIYGSFSQTHRCKHTRWDEEHGKCGSSDLRAAAHVSASLHSSWEVWQHLMRALLVTVCVEGFQMQPQQHFPTPTIFFFFLLINLPTLSSMESRKTHQHNFRHDLWLQSCGFVWIS